MPITDEERRTGIIHLTSGRDASSPATHVLVVGVGAYPKADLSPLTSPIASAKAVTGWFLGKGADGITAIEDGFRNVSQPLGSLALLLSEPADSQIPNGAAIESTFGDEPVLRATMPNTKAAVAAWVARSRANRDNLAILYLSGHGFSDNGHTAFVLEDRDDGNLGDLTNGLIDLTMFSRRLMRLPIRSQLLLFDCCRSRLDLDVPEDDPIGEAFLDREASAGPDIQQMALFATLPKEVAKGRAGKMSFYAESLIMALTHAAADKDTGTWLVSSAQLYSKMQSLLRLFSVAEQRFQRLDPESLADFPIHLPRISRDEVPTYVSLVDPSRWDEATLSIRSDGQPDAPLEKVEGQRFIRLRLRYEAPIAISASYDGGGRAMYEGEPDRPVCFARIGEQGSARLTVEDEPRFRGAAPPHFPTPPSPPPPVIVFKQGKPAGGFPELFDIAETVLAFPKAVIGGIKGMLPGVGKVELSPAPASTLRIVTPGAPERSAGLLSVTSEDGSTNLSPTSEEAFEGLTVGAGSYRVQLLLSDGQWISRAAAVAPAQTATIAFEPSRSPREWLATATEWGLLPSAFLTPDLLDGQQSTPASARLLSPLSFGSERVGDNAVGAALSEPLSLGPIARLDVADSSGNRFRKATDGGAKERPLWVEMSLGDHRFDIAIPSPGENRCPATWLPHVVSISRPGEAFATSVADVGQATPLFAFLARRDFAAAGRALDELLRNDDTRSALLQDDNPVLSAVVGVAAVASNSAQTALGDAWFEEFAEQHPTLPDAGIILARRIWNGGEFEARRSEVRNLLGNSFEAGIPMLGLALDWLASGLGEFGDEDDEAASMAREVRRMARIGARNALFTTLYRD